MKRLLFFPIVLISLTINAQPYLFFGGGIGYGDFNGLNTVARDFNEDNGHSLPAFAITPYYEFGVGNYTEHTMLEFRWTGEGASSLSKVPGSFVENANLVWRYRHVSITFGILPWDTKGFGFGASANLGRMRTKYSFGGEFTETNSEYVFSSDFFIEQTFRVKLRKKRPPYIFRVRPFYQHFVLETDLKELETQFNSNPDITFNQLKERFSNFGIRLHLAVPIRKKNVIYPRDPGYRTHRLGKIKIR